MTRLTVGVIVFATLVALCGVVVWLLWRAKKLRVSRRLSVADLGGALATVVAAAGLAVSIALFYEPRANLELSLRAGLNLNDRWIPLATTSPNQWTLKSGKTHLFILVVNSGPGELRRPVWIVRASPETVEIGCGNDMAPVFRPSTPHWWCQFNDPTDIHPFSDLQRPYGFGFDVTVPTGVASGTLETEIEGENFRTITRIVTFSVSNQ